MAREATSPFLRSALVYVVTSKKHRAGRYHLQQELSVLLQMGASAHREAGENAQRHASGALGSKGICHP